MKLTLKERIIGLQMILEYGLTQGNTFVSREYILEKLEKIRENRMSFHTSILSALEEERKK